MSDDHHERIADREADRLHDLTDKEIGKAWRSVKQTLPYKDFKRAVAKAIIEAARIKK